MRLSLLGAIALLAGPVTAQVCPGPLLLHTQAAVDAVACTSVEGDVLVDGAEITNVDALASITSIGGLLGVTNNDALDNLDGLAGLTSVGGALIVAANPLLTDLDGLTGLASVGGYVDVFGNERLAEVDGLAGLASVGGGALPFGGDAVGISVEQNPALARCAVGLGPILTADQADPATIGEPNVFGGNAPGGDCNAEADILAAFAAVAPVTDAELSAGTCGDVLPAGRGRCAVEASATLAAASGQRFTVFLRLDGPDGFSRLAFRGEVKPRAGEPVSQSIQLRTLASDPSGPYTVTLVAEPGSVPVPTAAAVDLASFSITKAAAGLRAAAPLTAHPNPAAERAVLRFARAEAGEATLVVYDALGREVARPVDGAVAGVVEVVLDAGDLAPGVYVARLATASATETVRLTVAR